MLRKLRIRNFALIDRLEIEFRPGLNVFTGETGAGKSIIVESVGFLLGEKVSSDIIKSGREFADVEGLFADPGSSGKEILLRRVIYPGGRKKSFVNGEKTARSRLAEIGGRLVDFHGQNENQSLLDPRAARELLDSYAGLEKDVSLFSSLFAEKKAVENRISALKTSSLEKERLIDLYRYQLEEIKKAGLKAGEDEELEETLPKLRNADNLKEASLRVYHSLYADEGSAAERLESAADLISRFTGDDPFFAELKERISSAAAEVSDAAVEAKRHSDSISVNPGDLEKCMARLDMVSRLKKKYGGDIPSVIAYADGLEEKINELENTQGNISDLEKRLSEIEREMDSRAEKLGAARRKAAAVLSLKIKKEAADLGFKRLDFKVSVEPDENGFNRWGADEVDFLFSPNPGERMKPLAKTASGGEVARIMLSIKSVLTKEDRIPVLVFDEVDAGVGSIAGRKVGEKLRFISAGKQVLCVTHLPQVAAFADAHFRVRKVAGKKSSEVMVDPLGEEARKEEIARMLSGSERISEASLRHAGELVAETSGKAVPGKGKPGSRRAES